MLKFDFRDFERCAKRLDVFERQIPFVLASTLNMAAETTMRRLATETWPSHVEARNLAFIKAALSTRGSRATKKNLRVEIYDRLGRGSLALHARGGTKKPRGASLAIPTKAVAGRRGARGVPKNLKPRAIPNSFVKQSRLGPVLFQRTGTYQKAGSRGAKKAGAGKGKAYDGRRLKPMYGFARSTPVPATVPFDADFKHFMREEVRRQFPIAARKAMATAFRK